MRISVSYNRTRIRLVDNAQGEYFLYTRPFPDHPVPRWFVSSNYSNVMESPGYAPYVLATSVDPEAVYIAWEADDERL